MAREYRYRLWTWVVCTGLNRATLPQHWRGHSLADASPPYRYRTAFVLRTVCMLTITGELTRDYLDSRCNDPLQRRLLMLSWQPDDMTHLSYEQHEDDEIFTAVCTCVFRDCTL